MNKSDNQQIEDQSEGECAVCNSVGDLTKHPFTKIAGDNSDVILCMEHKQLFEILGSDPPSPARDITQSTQQTRKVTTRVPSPLVEAADIAAEQQGQTRSELVRDAIQVYIELQEVSSATDNLLCSSLNEGESGNKTSSSEGDVEFLRQRIRKLESLLEDSIEKI